MTDPYPVSAARSAVESAAMSASADLNRKRTLFHDEGNAFSPRKWLPLQAPIKGRDRTS
jgi:hypothetical protein